MSLYTGVSQKRDLNLNENTCLNKGFNNNICSLCQLAIAIAQEGFCIGFVFFSFFVSHINAIFVDRQICLQFDPLPENENDVLLIAVLTHWKRFRAQKRTSTNTENGKDVHKILDLFFQIKG